MRALVPAARFDDDAVGERRAGLVDAEGRPLTLAVERWSERGRVAGLGQAAIGRVAEIAPAFSGAFVDIGLEPMGFLPFRGGATPKGLHEGAWVRVEIAAEAQPPAWGGKGPRLRRLPGTGEGPARLLPVDARLACDGLAAGAADLPALPPAEARAAADRAVEEAFAPVVGLPGGGDMALAPTRGFWAVDVDAGGRAGPRDRERFVRDANAAAAVELARQAALRGLAGMIVADFITPRAKDGPAALRAALETAFAALGLKADVAPVSRSALAVVTTPRGRRPLHERLTLPGGAETDETIALRGLRALEAAGQAARGAPRLLLTLARGPHSWLAAEAIPWRAALTARLGSRFALEERAEMDRARVDVQAV